MAKVTITLTDTADNGVNVDTAFEPGLDGAADLTHAQVSACIVMRYLQLSGGPGLDHIIVKRHSQVVDKGYTRAHDLGHRVEDFVEEAGLFLGEAVLALNGRGSLPASRPPGPIGCTHDDMDAATLLAKAGALIAAAIDRLHPQVGSTGNMMVVWTLAQTVSGPDGGTSTVYWTGTEHPAGLGPLVTSRLHRAGAWPTQAAAAEALAAHRARLPGYSVRPVTVHVVEAEEWWPNLGVTAPEAIAS